MLRTSAIDRCQRHLIFVVYVAAVILLRPIGVSAQAGPAAQVQAPADRPPPESQDTPAEQGAPPPQAPPVQQTQTLVCSSPDGQRHVCPADTTAGVILIQSTGKEICVLGQTWGYDKDGVWVTRGCTGEFLLGTQAGPSPEGSSTAIVPERPIETWGEFDPGEGFLVGRSRFGELMISAYALVRYLNQLSRRQTFVDHLGREQPIHLRNDIFPHRVIVYLKGWVGDPKIVYAIILWTVNTTDQNAIFGNLGYQFSRKFSVYAGVGGNPGSRSLQGSHPYWLGNDRVLADEFFRPYFSFGAWVQGEPVDGLWYNLMVSNNSSALGVTAAQLDRRLTTGGSVWWMPTTKEFGPRGAYGDFEYHENVATRFGVSSTQSLEQRFTDPVTGLAENTTLRLADSVNVFDTGALAPDVTVELANYRVVSVDAGLKHRGIFLQTEFYARWLYGFTADGPLPVSSILDKGFYVQAAFFPVPKWLEVYAATSQIFGDKDAGFGNSWEYLAGLNLYPARTRSARLNLQAIDVNRSPVSSTFGYYVGGQTGAILSVSFAIFF